MPLPTESLPPHYMQGDATNNRVAHTDRPGLVLVSHADPNFARDKHHEIEYEFSGRGFYADRSSAARMRTIEAP
jgi:hypothetical protein